MKKVEALKNHLAEIIHLGHAAAVLGWDQQVHMPPGGAAARAEQLATLSKLSHEKFVSDETGRLLEEAEAEVEGLDYDSDEAAIVRVTRHHFDLRTRLPTELVTDLARTTSQAHETWAKARAEADFPAFAPTLEKIYDLMRQKAEAYGYKDHMYDALLNEYEPHMKTAEVARLFDGLRTELVPLVAAIFERVDAVDRSVMEQSYDRDRQELFSRLVVERLGYDFSRGRLDPAVHPFTTEFSINDVRITTRYLETGLDSLSSSVHEAGHALYELGSDPAYEGTILAGGTSLGVHESQSRMWENLVGRSRGFWKFFYPHLQVLFPDILGGVEMETFYRALNAVIPSFIRVEADEVTYNLHVMLRFEMENDLLEGKLAVKDAPDAWNAKMEAYLGIVPPSDREGILQDVHWSAGLVGYFPTYSLGNFLSVQFWDKALEDVPSIPADIERGEFSTLLDWLRSNIHVHGSKYWPAELTERVTGESIQVRSFMRYLSEKYSDIYGL
jgi:carboxypeptidase Taq